MSAEQKQAWTFYKQSAGLFNVRDSMTGVRVARDLTEPDARLIHKAPELAAELVKALAAIQNPQAFNTDTLIANWRRILREAGAL